MRATVRSIGVACAVLLPCAAWGQTSRLCMVAFDTDDVVVIQNGALVDQWNNSGTYAESGLAVQATIKMVGRNFGDNGAEYAFDGTPLGGGPYFNPAYASLYDGATNGSSNWSVAHNDSATNYAVVVGDADWNNLQVAFVPTRRSSGITYVQSTGTLWVANTAGAFDGLQEYDLNGNLLTDIPLPSIAAAGYGLAWDQADDTLWITGWGGNADAYQLDFAGNVLQAVDVPGISGNWISAEFLPPAELGKLRGSDVAADNLLDIDTSTGNGAILGPLGDSTIAGLAWDPNHGILYASSTTSDSLYTIDPNTGATTLIGPFGGSEMFMHGLEYDSNNDVLYGITSYGGDSLYTLNVATGAATYVGFHGKDTLTGMAFNPATNTMYVSEASENNLYTINLATAAVTLVGPFNAAGGVQVGVGLAYDPVEGLFASDNKASSQPDDDLYAINPATGQATLVGPINQGNVLGLAFITESCPTYEEGFPDPLGGWNGRWLYQHSNLESYYVADGSNCDPDYRGNNPVGLWVAEPQGCPSDTNGPVIEWVFDAAFAATLSHLEFGIEAFVTCDITIYDASNNVLSVGTYSGGGYDFDHADIVSADSDNGISRVVLDRTPYGGGGIEGNISIDNVVASACPGNTCPWDCGDQDGTVGVVDFLAILAQWGGPGPCDFDGGGVGVTDFLLLLANWGTCPGFTVEEEPDCGLPQDSVNGGCNSTPNVFSPIACGQTYQGSGAFDGSTRDTDWYEVVVTEPTIFTWTVTAQFSSVVGLVEQIVPGVSGCGNITGYLNPFAVGGVGETVSVTTECMPSGTYYFFVAPDFSVTVPCPTPYEATLTCDAPCAALSAPRTGRVTPGPRTGAHRAGMSR
jgi:hypothetical protein